MKRLIFKIGENKAKEIATVVYNDFKDNFDNARINVDLLTTLTKDCCMDDGYELAKKLEDIAFCDINTLIVEQLDTISYYVDTAEKELNNKWIKDNNIKPLYSVGEEVVFNDKNVFIHEVREKEGKYLIPTGEGASYYIVDFEKVTGIQE